MPKLPKLSWLDITLVIILLVVGAAAFSVFRTNVNTQQDKTGLEARLKAAELNLSQAGQEVNLDSLRQALKQAQLALDQSSFPSEVDAVAFNYEIIRSAEGNGVTVFNWNSNYAPTLIRGKGYAVVRYSLGIQGTPEGLSRFLADLAYSRVTPVIQNANSTLVNTAESIWRLDLELSVYCQSRGS